MLPGLDGLGIVKTIRSAGIKTPILFLTAVDGIGDRVEGLEAGGDDYLVKPFAFAELAARVNALGRRPALADSVTALCVGDLQMDLLRRSVRRGDQVIELQPREFRLLEYLMRHPGSLSREPCFSSMSGIFTSTRTQPSSRRTSVASAVSS